MAGKLRQYHGRLCSLLDSSSDTLESLTVELYSNYIIDERTKNKVKNEKGYTGADLLLDMVTMKVKQTPGAINTVLKAMEAQEILKQLVMEMRKDEPTLPQQPPNDAGTNDTVNTTETKTEQEVLEEATALQDRFEYLLDEVRRQSKAIDVEMLQLRLNVHLARERENTATVRAVLSEIDQISDSASKILNCLIRCDLIGYMNYRLLDVFQKLIQKSQLDHLLQDYEEALKRFLKSTELGTLAQVFVSNPTVAPVTLAGLPRFTVHLNYSWEGRSLYSWDQLLKIRFRWPPHIQIVDLRKKCIIIEYGVFPFSAAAVVRDLMNPQMSLLLKEHGVIIVEFSDELKKIEEEIKNIDNNLLEAAELSNTEILESLLMKGASINATSTEPKTMKYSPLHLAAVSGNCAAVGLLIEYGADIDKGETYGRSPLHLAAERGKKEIVELLLKAGADIHNTDTYNHTPIYYARQQGNKEVVQLLLHKDSINNQKITPNKEKNNGKRGLTIGAGGVGVVIGGVVGSVVPGIGTVIGGLIGGWVGRRMTDTHVKENVRHKKSSHIEFELHGFNERKSENPLYSNYDDQNPNVVYNRIKANPMAILENENRQFPLTMEHMEQRGGRIRQARRNFATQPPSLPPTSGISVGNIYITQLHDGDEDSMIDELPGGTDEESAIDSEDCEKHGFKVHSMTKSQSSEEEDSSPIQTTSHYHDNVAADKYCRYEMVKPARH